MKTLVKRIVPGFLATVVSCAVALPAAFAQEEPPKPQDEGKPAEPPKPHRVPIQATADDPMQILREIESKMLEAEKLLAKASASSESTRTMQEVLVKLDELLKNAGARQQEVLDALKKLEDQAVPIPSGGGSGEQEQPSQQPKSEPRKEDREDKSLQKLDPGNSKDKAGKTQPQRQQPTSGKSKPPDADKLKASNPLLYERWGNLPPKVREALMQNNFDSFPPQYRALLERFYKRLADSEKSNTK